MRTLVITLSFLAGCSGPAGALERAEEAHAVGDLAAFERAVDVDVVIPQLFSACADLLSHADLDNEQFTHGTPSTTLIRLVEQSVFAAVEEQATETFRSSFAEITGRDCLDAELLTVWVTRIDRDHARAELTVEIDGVDVRWSVALKRIDGSWKVVSLDPLQSASTYSVAQLRRAEERALTLSEQLATTRSTDDWAAVRNYLGRHPDAESIAANYDEALAPLLKADPPLDVVDAHLFKPGGLFRLKHTFAKVHNPTPKGVDGFKIRLHYSDAMGTPIRASTGQEALVTEVHRPVPAHATQTLTARSGGWSWPGATRAEGVVIEITYEDGSTWTHPAVDAGAWPALPNEP